MAIDSAPAWMADAFKYVCMPSFGAQYDIYDAGGHIFTYTSSWIVEMLSTYEHNELDLAR